MADLAFIHERVLGGDGGKGVLIEQILLKEDENAKTKDHMIWLELTGTAKTVLNSNYSPESGFTDLPEAVPITYRIDVLNANQKDFKITFDMLNRAFKFKKPLVDRPEEIERFMQDGPDSVYDDIVGKEAFFKAKLGNGKTGTKVTDFFFSPMGMAQVHEAKSSVMKDVLAKVRAAKEAKEKAAQEVPF